MTKHKHHDVIVEWATDTSKVVQYKHSYDHSWRDVVGDPEWTAAEYRIKPEPPKDIVCGIGVGYDLARGAMTYIPLSCARTDNVRFTFSGETGKLIKAEVL